MNPPRNNSDNKAPPDDSLAVQIALAVEQPDAASDCPSDLELAAFIDGRLDDRQSSAMWQHLDACEDCYQTWLLATDNLESETTSRRTTHRKSRFYGFGAMAAAAMLAFVVLYLNWPMLFGTDTSTLIATAYDDLLDKQQIYEKQTLDEMVPLPWQDANLTYGFNQRFSNEPANLAFGAGLLMGRKRLADPKTEEVFPEFLSSAPYANGASNAWSDTAYKDFYQLGQWCVLLVAACKPTAESPPNEFWEQQERVASRFMEAFRTGSQDDDNFRIATSGIVAIDKNLGDINANTKKKRTCKNISAQAKKLIQFLSPVVKPE